MLVVEAAGLCETRLVCALFRLYCGTCSPVQCAELAALMAVIAAAAAAVNEPDDGLSMSTCTDAALRATHVFSILLATFLTNTGLANQRSPPLA